MKKKKEEETMQFNNEYLSTLPVVSEIKDFENKFNRKVYSSKGLFSEQIFGPVVDYQCQCGKMSGIQFEGQKCPVCEVEITSSDERSKRLAVIPLPFPIPKPNIILSNTSKYKKMIRTSETTGKLPEFDQENCVNYVVIIPPSLRPIRPDLSATDQINEFYKQIIHHLDYVDGSGIYNENLVIKVYKLYIELISQLKSKLTGKEGFIRERILGRRVHFSGRGVITPDPYLVGKVRIPYYIAASIFEPYLYKLDPNIMQYITQVKNCNYNFEQFGEIKRELQKLCNKYYVVLNRAPSLHASNLQAYEFELTDETIQIPPNVCPPFNADFDGDSVCDCDVVLYNKNNEVIYSGKIDNIIKKEEENEQN